MKTTLGIEFEPFFPQISHRAKIGCAKYDSVSYTHLTLPTKA